MPKRIENNSQYMIKYTVITLFAASFVVFGFMA